ncbi:MAG: CBS domain-containing protein [Roseburia sp.]|nr:CBS domain-containing protein [Roseburia sp.]
MNILFLLKPKNTVSFLYEDHTLRQGLEKMRSHGYTAAPVLSREGYYAGTVNEGDFLWHIFKKDDGGLHRLENERVSDIVRENWNQPVRVSATVEDLLERVLNQNFVPVVDDRNLFVGIITRKAVIKHFRDRIVELKQKIKEKE